MKPKMLKVTVYLWVDGLPGGAFEQPRHVWDTGVVSVRVTDNPTHNVRSHDPAIFNRKEDLANAVWQAVEDAGVTVHPWVKVKVAA